MSKGDGLKIGIKFTEDLVGNIAPQVAVIEKQDGVWTANGTYSGSIESARDGSTSTYWESRSTANYIQIARPGTKILGFKVYKGSSYRPSSYTMRTSVDGVSYVDVKTGSLVAATGWETIMFDEPTVSDYFRFNFGYTTRLYLYELVLIVEEYDNLSINDFVITGQERQYVNGPIINRRCQVMNFERHPTEPNSILITVDWWSRFNNVEGEISIIYDASKGSLAGAGGAIESFEVSFLPEDLVQTPNPGIEETILAYPYEIILGFKEIQYINSYTEETILAYPYAIELSLKHISEINP